MFSKTAQYYDLIYSFKDYADEAARVKALILEVHPDAGTILDVACGTGEHAKHLSADFAVDGIDLEPTFVETARAKVPAGEFWVADMSDFDLGRRYDVVQCLFSSIGYLTEPEKVVSALVCFERHLNSGGVILVEPWFTPDQWHVGHTAMDTVEQADLKLCRMSTSLRDGRLSKLDFHYLIATPEGTEHLAEDHTLALYTREEMLGFLDAAGLDVHHDPEGLTGRGLYVARRG